MKDKLRIGKIPYANLFPIFHELKKIAGRTGYEYVEGPPSAVNRMLRDGLLDVSPSSSVEYLRDRKNYAFMEGHSISSKGPVGSILLFSSLPMEGMGGREILVTNQTETSSRLLEIILRKFYSVKANLVPTSMPAEEALLEPSSYLSIGDEALVTAGRARPTDEPGLFRYGESSPFRIYDLGDIWHKNTGLPFVFALWIAKKNRIEEKKELFAAFAEDLGKAKALALKNLYDIVRFSPVRDALGDAGLISYWKRCMIYDLGEEELKGLELFERYMKELGLL
jgi:chorismate dehydratase